MRDTVNMDEAYILLYDSTGRNSYALYNIRASEENNALESYTVEGGENNPFEIITLNIPRKKLNQVASNLTRPGAVVNGVNKIYVNAVGKGTYIVHDNNLMTNDNTVKIVGYCQAAIGLRNVAWSTEIAAASPFRLIKDIITSPTYGGPYIPGKLRYWFIDKDEPEDKLTFPAGANLWNVLQVCAMYLGCKIFFSGNDAYLVDYRLTVNKDLITLNATEGTIGNIGFRCSTEEIMGNDGKSQNPPIYLPDALYDFDTIDIYTRDSNRPEYGKCVGQVSLGGEGETTIKNKVTIKCKDGVEATVEDTAAQKAYGMTKADDPKTLSYLRELKEPGSADINKTTLYHQGQVLAANIVDYMSEGQQSITFSMKELQSVGGSTYWIPFFPPGSRIKGVDDEVDDIHINNTSVVNSSTVKPQKLALSTYSRSFPNGITKYSFGIMESIDLPTALSELSANL